MILFVVDKSKLNWKTNKLIHHVIKSLKDSVKHYLSTNSFALILSNAIKFTDFPLWYRTWIWGIPVIVP
ncbi:MAG: hypothetical protein ACKESC_00440 [Candidatus Hodgkinia cicadicola]